MKSGGFPQVRIAVNSNCGKACAYCRPSGEVASPMVGTVMSLQEIVDIANLLTEGGVREFKLTGGDPALYQDIVPLVKALKSLQNVNRVEMVTRHPRAGRKAAELRDAGLDLLNFSLDSLDPRTWTAITGVRGHEQLVAAIRNATKVGIPIKINMVVLSRVNEHEISDMIEFCRQIGATLKLLDLIVDIGEFTDDSNHYAALHYNDLADIIADLQASGAAQTMEAAPGGFGHPMPTFSAEDSPVVQVKTAKYGAWYGDICHGCPHFPCHDALMALRLTPDGKLQTCLLRSDNLIDVLTPLRAGSGHLAEKAIAQALDTFRSAKFYERHQVLKLGRKSDLRRHQDSSEAGTHDPIVAFGNTTSDKLHS